MTSKEILILGAGRSSGALIDYLLDYAKVKSLKVIVADSILENAQAKINHHPNGEAVALDITNEPLRKSIIKNASIVVSLLPPHLHHIVAMDCLENETHLVTCSYVSEALKKINDDVKAKQLIFLNEIGLDPGIDHLSAMKVIDEVHTKGGKIISFKSWCGGLVAVESDDHPWHYKISWNPRNVVIAGKSTAQFLKNKQIKFLPYQRLFSEIENVKVPPYGEFDGYANRDSISYISLYNLDDVKTMLRGTLRHSGYCQAWNELIKLGYTDDLTPLHQNHKAIKDVTLSLLPSNENESDFYQRMKNINEDILEKMQYLELFSNEHVPADAKTPADVLQHVMLHKWAMKKTDKDLVVMMHDFEYELNGEILKQTETLYLEGENAENTAMAKTVGLPAAIATTMILEGKINERGVIIPLSKEWYEPILKKLEENGIHFSSLIEKLS